MHTEELRQLAVAAHEHGEILGASRDGRPRVQRKGGDEAIALEQRFAGAQVGQQAGRIRVPPFRRLLQQPEHQP